jgi:molybdopterin-containing oxidoreductase family membrane subunit
MAAASSSSIVTVDAVTAKLPIAEIGEIPLVEEAETFASITDRVARVTENKAPRNWWIAFIIAVSATLMLFSAVAWLFWNGVGVWGNNSPVYWGWDITNFVWWIGIGHAGTLISAVLFLFRQKWRTAINRFSEAMTIFAVICALVFPGFHGGRAW